MGLNPRSTALSDKYLNPQYFGQTAWRHTCPAVLQSQLDATKACWTGQRLPIEAWRR